MNRELIISEQANERMIKQYKAVKWRRHKMEGWLIVTTERLLFLSGIDITKTHPYTGAKTTTTTEYIRKEAEIQSISGIEGYFGHKINWPWLALGISGIAGGAVGIIAACAALSGAGMTPPANIVVPCVAAFVIAVAALVLGILAIQELALGKAFFLNIYSSQAAGTPISIGKADRVNHLSFSLAGLPAEQTVEMLEELGALIADLKADKEKAYEAWGEPEK